MVIKSQRKIKKIIQYRYGKPFATLDEIGRRFSCSRQYVHKVLKKNNVPTTRVVRKKVRYCPECGTPTSRRACVGKCSMYYLNRLLYCLVCRKEFWRKRWRVRGNYNAGYINQYCSRRCYNNRSHAKAVAVLQQPQIDAT